MPRKSRKNVGLIGLGIIGMRVAAGLRAAGFQTFVWNRSPKAAPNFLGSPAEVAGLCEIIQIFVADAQALFDVIDQMNDALTSRHLVICNATVGPEATIEAARLVEARGAAFLDAPFTGSKSAAEKRQLVYYLGGDEASCLRARPVLEATSRAIVRIGEIGHAATVKVVTNMIAAVSVQTLAEALAIVQKAGLDPEVLSTALEHNACRSGTMEMKLPNMIAGNYEPHFSLKHMFKDVQLGIHVANALDIEIPATTVTAGVMYGALNHGHGDLDFSVLYKVYETQVKTPPAALRAGATETDTIEPEDGDELRKGRVPDGSRETAANVSTTHGTEIARGTTPLPEQDVNEAAKAGGIDECAAERRDSPTEDGPQPRPVETASRWNKPPANSEPAHPDEKPGEQSKIARVRVVSAELVNEGKHPSPTTTESSRPANGDADAKENARPMNFVRRWFVSRGSGSP